MAAQAAIFPGQGAQLVGMGKDFADAHPAARTVFEQADQILGFSIAMLCFEGPAEQLEATDIQQPSIFVTGVAIYRAAVAAGVIRPDQFAAMGGLSLGEYTALHLADALSFEDALRLVYRRGQLMQQAARASSGGMVSVMGLDEDKALALCEKVASAGRIRPANFNCPGQIVLSGEKAGCDAAAALAEEFGGKAVPLKVAGAFHSDLMKPAAEGLRPVLEAAAIQTPRCRVIANVDAEYHGGPASIRDSLYRQVFSPVRWEACVRRLISDGCTEFTEFGPNRVLTGLMRKIDRNAKCANLSKAADLTPAA
ncbi:MAG: ACP S-malonyltransferase [Planctomycetes bacterium]|nr:ACP S-malonyltransferase [Planctomycetota bacterium]